MKYALLGLIALTLVGCGPVSTSDIVSKAKSGTFLITNKIDEDKDTIGTGFLLDDNMIITNHHVVDGSGKINIYSPNSQKRYEAQVVHKDEISDIAILKIVDWDSFNKEQNPINLVLGNSDATPEGSKVVIIGHPWGLIWTVSEGILSAKNRRIGQNPKYINQVDAKLFQGNSGGPIFNENGQVVCVSNMILKGEGGSYGFCIPSNLVKKVINDLTVIGEVRWRVINVAVGLTEDGSSVILQDVEANGAADRAGLKVGDKILTIITPSNRTGKKITKADDMITEMANINGNDGVVRLSIERNGETMMIDVDTNFKLSKDYTPDKAS